MVGWAVAVSAPIFAPVARAVDRMDEPEVGRLVAPLTECPERAEPVERALSDAEEVRLITETVAPPVRGDTVRARIHSL